MENLSYLLMKASRHLKTTLDQALGEFGITAAQFSVLHQIDQGAGQITAAEIANILNSDRPTISGIINRLEHKKLLIKLNNPKDKRSHYLKLSLDARELTQRLRSRSDKVNHDIFTSLTPKEREDFKEILWKLINTLEAE